MEKKVEKEKKKHEERTEKKAIGKYQQVGIVDKY